MSTPTIPDHDTSQPSASKKGALAGIGLFLACAIACSLPLVAAGGLAAGLGAFLAGGDAVALGVLLLVGAVVAGGMWLRGRRAGSAGCGDGCGC